VQNIDLSDFDNHISAWEQEAKTVVIVAADKMPVALFAIADQEKPHARQAVRSLLERGLKVVMITGDNSNTARAMAKKLGIKDFEAEVLPDEKLKLVKQYQKEGYKVAFVGDGVNDAPAITASDLGIAVGIGTDIAMEAGQIVLVGGGPEKVLEAIDLAKQTHKIIIQNLFWAFIYNIIGIPIAAIGLLNPMIASAAMAFSSVSVVLNSLRLKKK
ncbi:HAD family hydrolase, partial [Candidatus Parcubacteria bacterium]